MAKKILVVGDGKLVTKSLLKLLGNEGYIVTIAKSEAEAIEKVKANDFDLIVSDVRMPELDSIETIMQIRAYLKKSNKKSTPEVLITGYADMGKYEKVMDLKVTDYLYESFDTTEFLRVVKKNYWII